MSPQKAQVCKANALVEASYRLSVAEQRIMLACISQVRRDEEVTDEILYSVAAADFAAMSDTSTKQAYRELEKAALRLKRREVRLVEEPNGGGRKRKVLITGWVQTIAYVEEEGRVELRFSKDMLPYLTQLSQQFTRYALADVARMTSAHAIRLYELLVQWEGVGTREVSVEWLREALQLEGRYPAFRDLRRRVIEPATEQINEHSPINVTWSQRKSGRFVSHVVFKFGRKASAKADSGSKSSRTQRKPSAKDGDAIAGIPRQVLEEHARPGETYPQVASRLHQARREGAVSW